MYIKRKQCCTSWPGYVVRLMAIVAVPVFLSSIAAAPLAEAQDTDIPRFEGSPEMAAEMAGVYTLGFKIAMAAYHHKTSHPNFPREEYFELAGLIALKLDVELPPLPSPVGDVRKDSENARFYINQQVAPLIKGALQNRTYTTEISAIFDLATYSAMAIRFYSPALDIPTELLVEKIPELAKTAKLPEVIWLGPVKMMEQRKSIPPVQTAFFEMERLIFNYYGFMLDNNKNRQGSPP